MATLAPADNNSVSTSALKGKKHRKKKPSNKAKPNGDTSKSNGLKESSEGDVDVAEDDEPETVLGIEPLAGHKADDALDNEAASLHQKPNVVQDQVITASPKETGLDGAKDTVFSPDEKLSNGVFHGQQPSSDFSTSDTGARLEALARDRNALREEVAVLRRSLEEIQEKHQGELGTVREQLEETQGEKEHAESQYRNLLGKVNTIKSQLGERLKADAEDLAQARSRIEDLEAQNESFKEENEAKVAELAVLAEEGEQRSKELSTLRNRTNLSQQNWIKEREDLERRETYAKEEFEAAKQAMQDWEVLAMEERSIRENLVERVTDLEEQVSHHREAYERAASDRDSQSLTVDGLQRALKDIQEARKRELRELVENSQEQLESLRKQLQESEIKTVDSSAALESIQKELERAIPFEKEVKEKNLLIGKLRHEAVILNDHLTKALRFLKKRKPEDNIDKQIVTNHFLHFLALDRADPKKFQVLQIIAALLEWTDAQREQAGLSRPGASNPNLRTPISPWHRTPSTPALSTEFFPGSPSGTKESLAELWSNFLEREAEEGAKSSRSTSISSTPKPS